MTSTNDGKDVKSNQTSGHKSKTYYIELYTSLEKALSSDNSLEERTRHVCEAWRRVYSLYQHSAASTHPHLLSWLQRHTAKTVLQSKWAKSKNEQAQLTEAIDALVAEVTAASADRPQHPWEETLLQRAAWFRKALENPWDNPVLKSLINPNSEPVTDQQVLEWLISEHGIVLVTRLQQMVAAGKCDDLALLLASAVMDRARAAMPHVLDEQADMKVEKEDSDSFVNVLEREASFTSDEWEMLMDIELVLLLKTDKRPRCIELAKLTPLRHGFKMVERLRKRLETSPRDKKLWKHAKDVATIVTQVLIARCMVLKSCSGSTRDALYWCARALARLLPPPALRAASTQLTLPAHTARHLHTFCAALSAECKELKTDVEMKPFICELYVRAITAGMNELEQLKLNADKEAEARLYEQTLAGWFTQLGGRLTDSVRLRAECALTAFSVHPARKHYERVAGAQPPGTLAKQESTETTTEITSEYGSWANDSRTQSNLVKTSETLHLKQSDQHQANVLSTAILTEGEALGLEPELCQDLAVLLSGPRVKTLSWDMDREVLLANCRAYMERTHGGTRAVTTELKYLNLDLNKYQHLPEEEDDENDVFYGIEKGYEHEVQFEEPEEIWQNAFFDPEMTESANDSDIDRLSGNKNSKASSSGEDEDPLSTIAEAKKEKKKRAKEKDKEQKKKKAPKADASRDDSKERRKDKRKTKKERKDKSEQATTGSLNSLLGMKIAKTPSQVQGGEKRVRKKERRRESTFSYVNVTDSDYDSQERQLQISDEPNVLVDGVFSMDELKSPERLSVDSQSLDNTKTTVKSEIVKPVIKAIKARPASSLFATTSSDSDVARSKSPYLTPNQLAQKHVVGSKVKSSLTKLLQFRRNQNKIKPAPRPPPAHMSSTPTNSLVGMKIYNPDEIPKVYLNKKQSKQLETLSNDVSNLLKEVTPDYMPKTPYSEPEDKQRQNVYNVQKHSQQQQYNNPMYVSPNKNETRTDDYSQHNQLTVDSLLQSIYASPPKTTELKPQVSNHSPLKPTITYHPFHKSMQNLSTEKNDVLKKPLLINDPHYFSHQHAKTSASQLSPRIISNTVIKPPSQTAVEDDLKFHGNLHRTYTPKPAQNTIQTTKSDVARYGKQYSSMQNINEFPSSSQSDKRQITTPNNMLHGPAKTYSVITHSDAVKSTQALQINRHTSQSSSIQNQEDTRTQKSENDFDEFFKELMKTINAGSNSPDKSVTVALNKDVKVSSVQTPSSVVKKTDSVIPQSAKHIQQKKTENAPNTFSRLSYLHKNKQVENKVKLTDSVTLELNRKIAEHKITKAKYIKNEVTLSRVGTKNTNTQDVNQMIRKIEPSNSRLQKNNPVLTSMLESQRTPNILNYSNMPTTSRNTDQPNREDADLLLLLHNQTVLKPNTNVTATSDGFSQTVTNSQTNVETSTQQSLIGTKVKNINILDNCSKKDTSDDNEWKRVMDAIIATKTEPLGPNALDLALKKDQRRHIQNKPSGKPRVPGQSSSQTKSSDLKKREHISAKTNSTTRKSSTDRHEVKKPRESETTKKISPEMLNRLQVQNRQHLNMAKEHTSVIPNSDYDILGELLDDDLRQELGEISSDEDAYGVQNALVKAKNQKNIPKPYSICKNTMQMEKPLNSKTVVCKNQSNPNLTENVNSSTSNYSNVIINNSSHPTHIDNRLTNVSSTPQYVPSTTVITNQVAQDTANNILTHVEANQYINNIVPTNVIITSVPQPPVVVIRQNLVYDPYPTIRIHENQINPTVFAVNTAPNLAVYQTTQFAAPIINPIIIGNATTNTNLPNVMQDAPDSVKDLHITDEDNISLETALRLSDAISEPEPIMDFNMNRNSERKVLSQVHENHTIDEESYINRLPDEVPFKSEEEVERIKLKRQSLMNRNVNRTGHHPPIALSYTPLCNKVAVGKLLQQETPKNGTIPNLILLPNDIETGSSIEKSVTSEPNENIETTNQTNAKENKKTCRRIWLRSSNKLPNEKKTGVARSRVPIKRKPVKAQVKDNGIETTTDVVSQNKDSAKIPRRTSNRKPKKKPTKREPLRSTETQSSLDFDELIDFEKELDSSIVLKMPTTSATVTNSIEKLKIETEVGVKNTEDTTKSIKPTITLEPTVVIEKLKNRLGDQLVIKSTTVKTAAKEVNVIVKNQNLKILKENISKESLIAKESTATSNKTKIKDPKPVTHVARRSSLRIESNKLKPMIVDENVIKQTSTVGSSLVLDESGQNHDEGTNNLKPVIVADKKVTEKTPSDASSLTLDESNKVQSMARLDDERTNKLKPMAIAEKVIEKTSSVSSSLTLDENNKLKFVVRVGDQKTNKLDPIMVVDEKVIEETPLVGSPLLLDEGNKSILRPDDQKTSKLKPILAVDEKLIEKTLSVGSSLVLDESNNSIVRVDDQKMNKLEPIVVVDKVIEQISSVGSTMLLDESNKPIIRIDDQITNKLEPIVIADHTVIEKSPLVDSSLVLEESNKLNATPVDEQNTKVIEQTPLVLDESIKLKSIVDDQGVIEQTSAVSKPLNDQVAVKPQETPEVVPQTDQTHECHSEQHDTTLPEICQDQTINDTSQELTVKPNANSKEPTTVVPLNECITTQHTETTPPKIAESEMNHGLDSKQAQSPPQESHYVNTNPVLETDDDDVQIIETRELNDFKSTKADKTADKNQQKTIHATESLECKEKFNDVLNDTSVIDMIDVDKYLESQLSKLKQSNTNTKPDIKSNLTSTETSKSISKNNEKSSLPEDKEKAIYTKEDIQIEEVPLEDPNKKLLRILLPNGQVFKATVYGNVQGDVDSLFATPTMRAILSGANRNDGKRYTVNYKQIQKTINGDKKVREIQDLDIKEKDVASGPVDTVNLISDDEEEIQTRSFKTEFGKYTTKLDQEIVDKHQKKFDQKCEVKLIREDLFKSNRTKPKLRSAPSINKSLMTRNKSKLLAVPPTSVISENKTDMVDISTHVQEIATPLLKEESNIKIPIATDTPLLRQVSDIPKETNTDVIEIDDSSNDSLKNQAPETVNESIEPVNVTAMASLLLQSLSVETDKATPVPIKKGTAVVNLKSALLQDLGIVPVITPVIDITTNDDEKSDSQQQNETCKENDSVIDVAQKDNQISKNWEQFNIKKCAVKLIKCDELVKNYELIKSMKKCYVKIERCNNSLKTAISAPSEKTDYFNCENVEDFIEFDIDDPCSSPQLSRCPSLSILNNWDDESQQNPESPYCTSPVMEIYDTLAQLRNKLKTELIRESQKLLSNCDSEWTMTKFGYKTLEFMLKLSDKRTGNVTLKPRSDEIKHSKEKLVAFETPKLLSITLKFLQDNPEILYRFELMRKREIISNTKAISLPNKLKRKTEILHDTVASKILKLETIALNTINASHKSLAVIFPKKVEDKAIRQSDLINIENSNVAIIEDLSKYKSTIVEQMEDENQIDELIKTDNDSKNELSNEGIENKSEGKVYIDDHLPSKTDDINADISENNRDVTSPLLLCDYIINDEEKRIDVDLTNRENDEMSQLRETDHSDSNILDGIQKRTPTPQLSSTTEPSDEEKSNTTDEILQKSTNCPSDKETEISLKGMGDEEPIITDNTDYETNNTFGKETSSPSLSSSNEISLKESGEEEEQIILDDIYQQSNNDNHSDCEDSHPPLCDNDEINVKEEAEMCKPIKEEKDVPSEINCMDNNAMEDNKVVTSPPSLSDSYEINIDHGNENATTEEMALSASTSGETGCLASEEVITEDNDQIKVTHNDNIVTDDKEKQTSIDAAVEEVSRLTEEENSDVSPSENDSFINNVTEDNQEVTSPPALNNTKTDNKEKLSNNDNDEKTGNDQSQIVLLETSASPSASEIKEKETSINDSKQEEATGHSDIEKLITSNRFDEISIDEIPDFYEVVIVGTHVLDDIDVVETLVEDKGIIPMAKEIESEYKDHDPVIKSPDFIDNKKIIFNYHDYTKQPKKKQKLNNFECIANTEESISNTVCSNANEDAKLENTSTDHCKINKSDCTLKSKPDSKYELIQEDGLLTVEITTENDKIDKNKSVFLSPDDEENSIALSPSSNTDMSLKGYEFEDVYVFPLSQAGSNNSNVSNDSLSQELNTDSVPIPDDLHDIDYQVKEPKVTYSRKRKMSMRDVRIIEKKYRKGKNIDCSKQTQLSIVELAYSKEYKRLLDYCSSVKLSYSRPFHKECVELDKLMGDWPINNICCDIPNEVSDEHLFVDLEHFDNFQPDPTTQTFVEEISYEYDKTNAAPENPQSEASEANFNMGFGEGSGRVIQNLKIKGESNISAATLSDVKQSQPVSRSVDPDDCNNTTTNNDDQITKIRQHVNFMQLRDKVRQFFERTTVELKSEWQQQNTKDIFQKEFPFGLCSLDYLQPLPTNAIVHVVQVGQLPVSAAAQNPVTCDPRVTQVSDASPSQCSVDNSPNDDSQSEIKTEYTELTTADLTLPLQEYQQNQASLASQENVELTEQTISLEMEIKAEESSEIKQERPDINDEKSNSSDTDLHTLSNTTTENMDYSFEKNTSKSDSSSVHYDSSEQNSSETFAQQRQQNGNAEKTDQIAHAMNAAGITTTPETANNTRAHALVNILSQKIRQGSVNTTQTTTNTYSKATSINAMALQQALAQILPPPLNQTGSNENNQQSTSVGPQVLHIVQGKNASGNQITLVDNSQQSVISTPNATQVLHIVQNKNATTGQASNGTLTSQGNSFSGLSLVDAGLQQGGNQLLHIVNTGNQKTGSPGQLLKRVNLLTNLTNVQGSNEQKMVQFVCKSADGKAIQLNAPHQRSMVLRLQPIETPNVQIPSQKPTETQELSPSPTGSASSKESASQQEIKSRSIYEENYAKFIQNSSSKTPSLEKSTSLPKFNQAFGKPVFQEGSQKQGEAANNNSHLPPGNANSENAECPANDNAINMEHMGNISSPPLLIRKPVVTTQSQSNIVQQIKQTIAPMNIQTMHGGVIYTRQIPVNIGGGQTINLITVPSTELINDEASKTQSQTNQGEIEPSIIKIVPQNQSSSNTENSQEESNNHASGSSENAQTPQPQPVLTQMRIKLPMLSKAPQMVPGARVVRPSFFQIQRNVIGGANQPVYQQLVLTAAPPLGQQTIRLPAQASRPVKVPSESSSSESQMSSSTLEQLREFDMVLEQVKERSTSTPSSNTNSTSFKIHTSSADTTDSNASGNCSTESGPQVLYSIGNNQSLNVAYVNRKNTVTTPTTSTYVRSPDSSGIADSPTSSSHGQIPHTVTSDSSPTEMSSQSKPAKVGSKSKSRPKSTSNPPNTLKLSSSVPPKTSSQKPLEDEQTTQRILYILAEYKEQVENSPDKDKPAPRRRSNPPSNPGSSKRKKSSSSRRSGTRDMSPVGEDTCRTMGSEDSSCGTSQGDCTESCLDSHSPQDSPRKVARKITFDQDLTVTQPRPQPQRNVIVADGQTITVARGTTGKPATAVLMPANYILPVSMVKGGQQIAIVTNRGPKLLTVGGEGGATNALLLQRLIGPAGLKPVLTRPGVRHVRLPTAALHNLQAFNLARATVQPPDSTASPTPGPTPPELVDTRANSSPWTDRDEVKPERGSSPEGSEPWNLPSTDAHEYTYEEAVRTDNMDRTVLDPIPDRYSPDMEAQRIFDKMFDVDSKKSYAVDSRDDSPRCAYDIDPSECDDKAYQVVQKKDGSQRQHRLSHVSAAALRHKYAILEHELRLQKSLSEECEDLGVDSPSASELFPEAELLFANSPAHEHNQEHHSHTPQPHQSSVPQPDMDDQIATDHLIPREIDVNLGLGDVGIVAVSEDGSATIALDQEEFARSHPNTTFHSEPTDGEVQPFTITGLKGRHITSTIFHSNSAPATVLMTAPQATVISQAPEHSVKYEIENMINSMPSSHNNDINLSSVVVKDDGLTRFDSILTDSRELHLTNTASAIVHSSGNATQVIRRVCYEDDKRERDARYLIDEPDNLIAGDDAKMIAEDSSRDATLESMADVDDDRSSPERHAELFWESNSASERSESRRPLDFSSDSDKCCKSPSFDETNSTDSSGVGTHMRLDSVIKEARGRERSGSADGSSADDTHPPLRTYPPKRLYHPLEGEAERSLSGKTRAGERSPDSLEVRRRASGRGVVKRGCHCCNGSPAPPRPKKPRQRKPTLDFNTNN